MKKELIEVFTEKNCSSCEEVLLILTRISSRCAFDLRIYKREEDRQIFHERHVVICPATFLNGRLVFYGTFTFEAFTNKLTFNQQPIQEDIQ
jgi:predicted thioredoxin/glutaredoxin